MDNAEAADIIECPDGLVLWPEYNVCAPRVDECEAWEVPVIGGGCMAVGPRACPKLWDPDADVDCEPGELMDYDGEPCPEGFILTEDEVACIPFFEEDGVCGELEIPVLGGGCQRVGPEWAVPGQPLFDECGDGLLALPGGGCVMIGPRGCPKVWDPDADVDCEVGDVLPCPEGWMESDDGMYCHPGWDECPHGEVPLTGGGCERLLPEADDCPAGPFPEVPDGATDVQYVLADSPCVEGCGTEAAPYPSIQAAIDAAPLGATVLVGPGTYAEGLTLDKSVHVIGLCSAVVEVTGKGLVLPDGDSKVLEAGVGIFDVQGATLTGLRIESPAAGVAIVGATDVTLETLEVNESHGVALYVDGGSAVQVESLWCHETETGSGEMGQGRGVWLGGGSQLQASDLLVELARNTGMEIKGEDTQAEMSGIVVRNTASDAGGMLGFGIAASDGSLVSVSSSLVEMNRTVGLGARDPDTAFEVQHSVVRKTQPNEYGAFGFGVNAENGGTVILSGSLLEENRAAGVATRDPDSAVQVHQCVIHKTQPTEFGALGIGVNAEYGATVILSGSLLEENRTIGIVAGDVGTELEVSGSVIRKTMSDGNGEFGTGIEAYLGSSVSVVSTLIEENRSTGLTVIHSGTEVEVSGSIVRTTMSDENGGLGYGIKASQGCKVAVSGCLLEENREAGLLVAAVGTEVEVLGSVIRKTLSGQDGKAGRGIFAFEGCTVSVGGCLLEENRESGVAVVHSGTEVEISGTVIRKTMSDGNGDFGRGIQATDGCKVSTSDSLLEENREAGLTVFDSGTEVEVAGTVIRKTQPSEDGWPSRGIQAYNGCALMVVGSLLEENRSEGLVVGHSDTQVEVSRSVIRKTMMDGNGEFGNGIYVMEGCAVSVSGSLLEENRGAGLTVFNSGTEVEVSGTVIRETLPIEDGRFGRGVQAYDGSAVSVAGSILEENWEFGLSAFHSGTEVELVGSVIRETVPDSDGMYGGGLFVQSGASGLVSWSRIEGNSTAGIITSGGPEGPVGSGSSLLQVAQSIVLNTKEAGYEMPDGGTAVGGDGVLAFGGAELRLDSVVVAKSARAGVFYHESSGDVLGSMIVGSGSYGLAMQDSDPFVALAGNSIFGNVLEDIAADPQGLPVPSVSEAYNFTDPSW